MNNLSKSFLIISNKLPIIMIMVLFAVRLFSQPINAVLLNYIMPIMMIWCLFKDPGILKNNIIIIYILLLAWILLSVFTSVDINRSLRSIRPTVGGFITSIVMFSLSRKSIGNATWLMVAYVVMYFSSMYYISSSGVLLELDVDSSRLVMDNVNANDFAYYLFYTTIAFSLIIWDGKKKLKRWNIIIFLLLIVLALYTSIITASRQIIFVVLPFIVMSAYFRFKTDNRLSVGFVIGSLLMIVVAVLVYRFFSNVFSGSYLEHRMQSDLAEDSRFALLKYAVVIGFENPFFGVGPGNYELFSGGSFSHCSYTELFATSGLLPSILFIIIVVKSSRLHYKRFLLTQNRVFLYLFIATLFWALYNFLYAFYISPWLISFLFLLNGYNESFYKQICYENT